MNASRLQATRFSRGERAVATDTGRQLGVMPGGENGILATTITTVWRWSLGGVAPPRRAGGVAALARRNGMGDR